ncbi:MAG TPA: peptidylprolyl isomerase [Burkholderiales bacterium]|nr:peptidylprolyl isomerase [Burkholderiales bacterium]
MAALRRLLAALALFALPMPLLVSAQAAAQRPALVDRIVAIVNKDVITLSELNEAIATAERNLRRTRTQLPPRDVFERQMLERLVLDKAQLQLAKDSGIRIDDAQVDRAMQRVAEQNNLTLSDFRKRIEADGITFEQFRADLRDQITLQRLREREVDDKIQVSDTEVDLFLAETAAQSAERSEYELAHVLIRLPEQAAPDALAAARARAEQARTEALKGDFGAVAARYSDSPDALRGGLLGWRQADRLPELFAEALTKLNPGDVSEVLRSPAGFHIIKMLDRRGAMAAAVPIVQTRARHILVRTSETVSEAEARRRLAGLRERIVNGADFAALARANSDDSTAARGGELDWIYPGDTVPEFERAMNELKPGEVSQPVRTPFGYHLIQVIERRSADMSPERRRLQARQALRERKSDEAFQQWLSQLRDQTYVELRLEER